MKKFKFTKHAFQKFFERNISPDECIEVFKQENIIQSYSDDKPFPSELRHGEINGRIIHIVSASNSDYVYIITAYIPNPKKWNHNFTERK